MYPDTGGDKGLSASYPFLTSSIIAPFADAIFSRPINLAVRADTLNGIFGINTNLIFIH